MRSKALDLCYAYSAEVRIVYLEQPREELLRRNGKRDTTLSNKALLGCCIAGNCRFPARRTRSATRSRARPRSVCRPPARPRGSTIRSPMRRPGASLSSGQPTFSCPERPVTRQASFPYPARRPSSRARHAFQKPRYEPHLSSSATVYRGRGRSCPKSRAPAVPAELSRACAAAAMLIAPCGAGAQSITDTGDPGEISAPASMSPSTWDYGSAPLQAGINQNKSGKLEVGRRRDPQEQWRARRD